MSQAIVNVPYSSDAEQAVLGGLMLDNARWDDVLPLIRDTDFYLPAHRRIFQAMGQLMAIQQPIDLITLSESFQQSDAIELVGGFAYLAELSKNTPSAANIVAYTHIVAERSRLRGLLFLGRELSAEAANPRAESAALTARAEQQLLQLSEHTQLQQNVSLIDGLNSVINHLETVTGGNGITGTPTGFAGLDEMTCGLQPGDLILIAARPSMGKTAFALSCYTGALRGADKPAFFFSLEMPRAQLLQRLLAMEGRLELSLLRNGQLNDEDWARIFNATEQMVPWNDRLIIDDESLMTPALLRSRARRYTRLYGKPSVIMVDYLQLMSCPGQENRTQEIAEISRSLKALAKELDCPVVALSQLNRQLESRADKRPVNGDLRDSGALEQDADVIAFIYRDEVYCADSADAGTAEIIIGKQRQGATGTVRVRFEGQFTAFSDLHDGQYDYSSGRA
ncbi:MAG: SPI-7-type island replicative DNA helicase [Enterobacterales bacterium endosymbiont of Blomia tropicalis]|uniref:SPI-7-type island replicative DNA helicase n=1 Tax=Mixta mediterraneensis TaxID=2758443 RepID=UPI0025A8BA5D|nr:SPI-7-type island replicative DNA helicase [Mixta mediterraneensis]MDL4914888.1 SPI-7-type island replicative DNA helicase [Mixta mediterraneensis]